MKKYIPLIFAISIVFSQISFANEVVTTTSGWRAVPIEVDTTNNTYTVPAGPAPTGDYYYSYSGYRCFREARNFVGINSTVFKAGVGGGGNIYCYPEQ